MGDYMIRGIEKFGRFRFFAIDSTNTVRKARELHETSATASAALGRTLTAGLMMGYMMKNENDVLTLKISGDGPGGIIYVVAKNSGMIKGYINNPKADLESRPDGKLDVGSLVGRNGSLRIIMDQGLKEPYIGQSQLVSGEIAEDLAAYYAYSEQQPSVVNLGVLIDRDLSVIAAGGYIIQLLPDAREEDIDLIEKALKDVEPISKMIEKNMSPEKIIGTILKDFEIEVLERKDVSFQCDCSRGKIEKAIISLGREEIKNIIEEDKKAELVCHFCNEKYAFNEEELNNILNNIS